MQFVAILIVWSMITLLGHGSWVLVRGFFRLLAKAAEPGDSDKRREETSDIAATRRVVARLAARGFMDPHGAAEMYDRLRRLEYGHTEPHAAATGVAPIAAEDRLASRLEAARHWMDRAETEEQPIEAELVANQSPPVAPVAAAVEPEPTPAPVVPQIPVLSRSQLIQSFLAAHNIRWGELAAGMLIVICSIGLVISLWSPLVKTHRVIPSLIFLGANAAIDAAGLYTLSRWRLRHTSRAVLVIATLLVPLSVLAGLAAAGTTAEAVQLGDPITLCALALASGIYGFLLYRGGKALSGRWYAWPIVLSVAGPVSVLPLVPAAVRSLNESAGWIVGLGAAAILLSAVQMVRLRKRTTGTLGVASGRARLLVMAFGGFSLAVAIGYTAFAVRQGGLPSMLAVAIAAIPAIIALAGSARELMKLSRRSTMSMTGAVLCVILIAVAWTILPVSLTSAGWLWAWGLAYSISAAIVGWRFSQSGWLALASLPIGMAVTLTSPLWLGQQGWQSIALWQRIIGGEPMLAACLVAAVVAAAWSVMRDPDRRRWLGYATVAWVAIPVAIAAGLTVGPESALGIAPWWTVSLVLMAATAALAWLATYHVAASRLAVVTTVFAWMSIFQPIHWKMALAAPRVWMLTTVAVGVTLLLFVELLPRLMLQRRVDGRNSLRAARTWQRAAEAAAILAGGIACLRVFQYDWADAALTLAAVAGLLFWSSSRSRSIEVLSLAQIASIVMAVAIGHGRFRHLLFDEPAWRDGAACWAWAVVAAVLAGAWMWIRFAATAGGLVRRSSVLRRRFGYLGRPSVSTSPMPDSWTALGAAALLCSGSAWSFAALLGRAVSSDLVAYDAGLLLPVVAFLACGAMAWWVRKAEPNPPAGRWIAPAMAMAVAVWAASQIAHMLSIDPTSRLILATSLSVAACLAVSHGLLSRSGSPLSPAARRLAPIVAVCLVASASAALLWVNWLDPILAGARARPWPVGAVATWWMIGAAALLWTARRTFEPAASIASAVLAPAAVALLVPVFTRSNPAVWVQVAAITSTLWTILCQQLFHGQQARSAWTAIKGSTLFAVVVGVVTSLLVTISVAWDVRGLQSLFGAAGFASSVLVIGTWCGGWIRLGEQHEGSGRRLSWPIGLAMLAGQVSWLTHALGLVSTAQMAELMAVVWLIASAGSLVLFRQREQLADFVLIGVLAVLTVISAWLNDSRSLWMPWLALAELIAAGLLVGLLGVSRRIGELPLDTATWFGEVQRRRPSLLLAASRLLGWFVIVGGGWILVDQTASSQDSWLPWTMLVLWAGGWVVSWRLICADQRAGNRHGIAVAVPDMEIAALLMVGVVGETVLAVLGEAPRLATSTLADPLLWGRVTLYLALTLSAVARAGRPVVWTIAITTLVATVALVSVQTASFFHATPSQRYISAALASGFAIAFIAHWLPALAGLATRFAPGSSGAQLERLVQATWQVAVVVASAGGLCAVTMIVGGAPPADANLTIVSVALAAWAIAEMAESCNAVRLRRAAVTVALISIGLWASVDSGETGHPMLTASMRWLVAAVFTIPMLLFVFPKLLGQTISARWRDAFRSGVMTAGVAAVVSLISMLVMEATVRSGSGIDGVAPPLVIGVAVTLAILSGLAGLIAILSGPAVNAVSPQSLEGLGGIDWRERLGDRQRTLLIVAAQLIGGITWLHVFLCRPQWSFIGLRAYWPYIVMGLAFISVAATEWARRRNDEVLSRTLAQTALYLPLLPVIGFWISGQPWAWTFRGGQVRYDLLLAIAAAYYVGLSSLWKGVLTRIAAVVLGNAAWWIVLVQQPGWGFLSHPQFWLIPPAACVLVVAHLYRDRLEPAVAAGVRYAATLVIYISSTADMLLQQIGTNLSGPIILVLLALVGMAAGVALRVRAFLYLGALFVFLGVTSMVWHAHRAVDAVWPWWVFGITTGICLLAGLMALEKNKPKLREYASKLASWEG
jgi:hypothetical protein